MLLCCCLDCLCCVGFGFRFVFDIWFAVAVSCYRLVCLVCVCYGCWGVADYGVLLRVNSAGILVLCLIAGGGACMILAIVIVGSGCLCCALCFCELLVFDGGLFACLL